MITCSLLSGCEMERKRELANQWNQEFPWDNEDSGLTHSSEKKKERKLTVLIKHLHGYWFPGATGLNEFGTWRM